MRRFLVMFLLISIAFAVNAEDLKFTLEGNIDDFNFSKYEGYDFILTGNGRNFSGEGSPSLPAYPLRLSIPQTANVVLVTFVNKVWDNIGNYNVLPQQMPIPFGEQIIFTGENEAIYSEDKFYPENPIITYTQGNKSGFIFSDISYSPLRYNPVTKELQYLKSCEVIVKYNLGTEALYYLSENQREIFSQDVESFVSNPEAVLNNAPLSKNTDFTDIEYIIITPTNLVSSFQPLIDWKIQKGISAAVIDRSWVISNYTGYDDMEKIREFVKDYHQNHGLVYLVLAGDHDNFGARIVPLSAGSYTETTPCDLYFSDVVPYSSDWDANNNYSYGERIGDGCDWYSDVYVGRFSLNTTTEVARWINKLLTYEQNPPTGFIERSLQGGAGLWPQQNYYGDRVCDSIADNHLPSWWTHVKKYENHNNTAGFPDSLSSGFGWCHIAGHGNQDGVYWDGPGSMIHSNDNPTNGMKLGVIHSIACIPGRFDNYECCAEYYFNAQDGGAIAIMFNARYGWGAPPNMGPSEWIDIWTAEEWFDNENWNIGAAHGLGKDGIITGMDGYDHWCLTELNLFGDPETQIWSRQPTAMNVSHPAVIYIGSSTFSVNVSDSKAPIEGAVCCLSTTGDTTRWFKDVTNSSGNANISCNITSTDDIIFTVYAHDYLYYVDTINVATTGAYVTYSYIDNINGGHNNSQINPGCNYDITLAVTNWGTATANGVNGTISSNDANITIDADTINFGNIGANDTVVASSSYHIDLGDNIDDNYSIPVTMTCWDDNDSTWTSSFNISVNAPDMNTIGMFGPDELLPGDTFTLGTKILNEGSGYAYSVDLTLRTNDSYITIEDSTESSSQVIDTLFKRNAFFIDISGSTPDPHFVEFIMEVEAEAGYSYIDTFIIGIGTSVFSEDFETGGTGWTYSGTSCWHLTQRRSNSTSHSMFSGNETGSYSANIDNARAISPQFTVSAGTEMTFWHWYDIEHDGQGWDGCQLQYSTNSGSSWSTLYPQEGYDYTWYYNASDSIYTGSQSTWEIQHVIFNVTGNVNICWWFDTDGYTEEEGYYFDDINIGAGTGLGVEEEELGTPGIPVYEFALMRAYPNPVRGKAMIAYSIGTESQVRLKIYDITGREVSTLVNLIQPAGMYKVEWDGRDNRGTLVSSGTYFYRLEAGNFNDGSKLVVVR